MSLNNLNQLEPSSNIGVFYMGVVVANNDPDKMERIKCTIQNMYDGQTDDLPWVSPAVGRMFGNNGTFGTQSVPRLGTKVWVMMQNGDPHHAVYLGGLLDKSSVIDLGGSYPDRYGFIDAINNKFYVDQSDGTVEFNHFSGTIIKIMPSGEIDITTVANLNVTASGTVNIMAPTINLN